MDVGLAGLAERMEEALGKTAMRILYGGIYLAIGFWLAVLVFTSWLKLHAAVESEDSIVSILAQVGVGAVTLLLILGGGFLINRYFVGPMTDREWKKVWGLQKKCFRQLAEAAAIRKETSELAKAHEREMTEMLKAHKREIEAKYRSTWQMIRWLQSELDKAKEQTRSKTEK